MCRVKLEIPSANPGLSETCRAVRHTYFVSHVEAKAASPPSYNYITSQHVQSYSGPVNVKRTCAPWTWSSLSDIGGQMLHPVLQTWAACCGNSPCYTHYVTHTRTLSFFHFNQFENEAPGVRDDLRRRRRCSSFQHLVLEGRSALPLVALPLVALPLVAGLPPLRD